MNTNLTNQMTQLVGEIASLREARVAFQDARTAFVGSLADSRAAMEETCSQMREGFQAARTEMADRLHHDLHEFTSNLKQNVNDSRDALAGDLAGARQAWNGNSGLAASPPKTRAEESTATHASKARRKKG